MNGVHFTVSYLVLNQDVGISNFSIVFIVNDVAG